MDNQPIRSTEKIVMNTVQIVVSLSDVPIEVRKKSANEPIYITHL